MEISFHLRSLDAAGTPYVNKPGPHAKAAVEQEVIFENSRALTVALEKTPESRDEVVRRATELIGDVDYPPRQTIQMISHLLAIQLHPLGDGP